MTRRNNKTKWQDKMTHSLLGNELSKNCRVISLRKGEGVKPSQRRGGRGENQE
jgi:hypothetical protein